MVDLVAGCARILSQGDREMPCAFRHLPPRETAMSATRPNLNVSDHGALEPEGAALSHRDLIEKTTMNAFAKAPRGSRQTNHKDASMNLGRLGLLC